MCVFVLHGVVLCSGWKVPRLRLWHFVTNVWCRVVRTSLCPPRCAHLERSHCTVWSNGLMPIGSHLAHYYMPCQHSPGMCAAYRCTIMCAAPEANIGSQCVHLCVCVPMPGESEGVIREHTWHCAALHSAICFGMPLELLESADCAQVQRHLAEGALA